MWDAFEIFLFLVGSAIILNGWPKFITINHNGAKSFVSEPVLKDEIKNTPAPVKSKSGGYKMSILTEDQKTSNSRFSAGSKLSARCNL